MCPTIHPTIVLLLAHTVKATAPPAATRRIAVTGKAYCGQAERIGRAARAAPQWASCPSWRYSTSIRTRSVRSAAGGASMERICLLGLDFSAALGAVAAAIFHTRVGLAQVRMSR